jgi:hypothetical protein
VLFHPFEKQLDLPTVAIEFGDGQRTQSEIVGQKDKLLVGLGIDRLAARRPCFGTGPSR